MGRKSGLDSRVSVSGARALWATIKTCFRQFYGIFFFTVVTVVSTGVTVIFALENDTWCLAFWKGVPSRESQHLITAHHVLDSNGALHMLYLIASFPCLSDVGSSTIIPFHNWANRGPEWLRLTSSVALPVLPIWPLCRHCPWHNPHFHLGFWRNLSCVYVYLLF